MVPVKNKLFSDGLISMKFNLPVIKADHSRLPPVIQSFRYVMPPCGAVIGLRPTTPVILCPN